MPGLKILNIVGARPNFMKIAPIVRAFQQCPGVEQRLIHTGQHYDENLSRVFFTELAIPKPDINLGIGSGGREEQIERIMEAFEPVVRAESPQGIIVVGDVNSTIACARVAKAHGVRVAHVEAGLRSFDLDMPEEHNRRETDELADLLFVTESAGIENLGKEKVPGKAFLVGNVMIDTVAYNLERVESSQALTELGVTAGEYALSTFHRPSNVDSKEDLSSLLEIIRTITKRITLILPLHPRTANSLKVHGLEAELRQISNLILCDPLGYLDFMKLITKARVVVTDSGGIQEETTYLGVPCVTMRENTERPVTITLGTNVLVGTDREKVIAAVYAVLDGQNKPGQRPPMWDGQAAERIVEIIINEWSE